MTYSEIIQIYTDHALEPSFKNTMYSALFLIFAPGLTNIYYTFRFQSVLSKVMPFVMPIVALTQYIFVMRNDLEEFCYNETNDAETIRKKYHILSHYETKNNRILKLTDSFDSNK